MDFRHLRAFVAVAEELHFTRAAERLHISQPPLSRHIRQLEQEVGVALFERTRPRVVLTAAGHRLLRQAQELVAKGDDFLSVARAVQDDAVGLVKVGIGPGLWRAVDRARAFHERRFPYVSIDAIDLMSHEQADALLRRRIDVGFSRDPVNSSRLWSEPLFEEGLVGLLPRRHRLARRRAVRLKDLAGDTLLLHERKQAPVAYDRWLGLYAAAKIAPKTMTVPALPLQQAVLLLVAAGRGICLASERAADSYLSSDFLQRIAVVPLHEPASRISISAVWRASERSSTVLEFLQSVRETLRPKRQQQRESEDLLKTGSSRS
jgi:DNA-binding transcriptional LysR family regulator